MFAFAAAVEVGILIGAYFALSGFLVNEPYVKWLGLGAVAALLLFLLLANARIYNVLAHHRIPLGIVRPSEPDRSP